MNISSLSSSTDYLLQTASQLQGGQVQAEIATAVLKNLMDQQAREAQALLKMMQHAPSPEGTGRIVDIFG